MKKSKYEMLIQNIAHEIHETFADLGEYDEECLNNYFDELGKDVASRIRRLTSPPSETKAGTPAEVEREENTRAVMVFLMEGVVTEIIDESFENIREAVHTAIRDGAKG